MASGEGVASALRSFLDVQSCRAQLYSRFHEGFQTFLQTKQEARYQSLMGELTTAFNTCSRTVITLEASLKELGRPDLAALLRQVQEAERDKLRLTLTLQALKQAAAFQTFSWQQKQHQAGGSEEANPDDDEALALLDPVYAATRSRGQCCHAHAHGHDGCSHGHVQGHGQAGENGQIEGQNEGAVRPGAAAGLDASEGTAAEAESSSLVGQRPEAGAVEDADGERERGGACRLEVEKQGAQNGGIGNGGATGQTAGGCAASAPSTPPPEPTRREYEAAVKEATLGLDDCIRKINEAIGDIRMELEGG